MARRSPKRVTPIPESKTPFYRRRWFIALAILAAVNVLANANFGWLKGKFSPEPKRM